MEGNPRLKSDASSDKFVIQYCLATFFDFYHCCLLLSFPVPQLIPLRKS